MVDLAIERDGECSGPLQKCAQRFVYDWDEVGQLSRARRFDYATLTGEPLYPSAPDGLPTADLSYQYAGGERVLRGAVDPSGTTTYAVTPLADVRLNHAQFTAGDYEATSATETVYLAGMARAVYAPDLPGSPSHVFFTFGDHLGSASVVVDQESSALVEYVTYQAYGATESDSRPDAWRAFREDYRFTGKEDDIEVGLTYFGARYYSPYLARFISPDPLTVHALGSDLNPYAYVGGRVFNATDPFGLDGDCIGAECTPVGGEVGIGGSAGGGSAGGSGSGATNQVGSNGPPASRYLPPRGSASSTTAPPFDPALFGTLAYGLKVLNGGLSLDPATPAYARPLLATVPDDVADHDIPLGTASDFGVGCTTDRSRSSRPWIPIRSTATSSDATSPSSPTALCCPASGT